MDDHRGRRRGGLIIVIIIITSRSESRDDRFFTITYHDDDELWDLLVSSCAACIEVLVPHMRLVERVYSESNVARAYMVVQPVLAACHQLLGTMQQALERGERVACSGATTPRLARLNYKIASFKATLMNVPAVRVSK